MSSNGYHDKIRKILAMLEGAKTDGEAKAANLALQRLLAKSNLTAEQVGALGSEDPSASIEEEPVYIGSNDVVWKRMLASAIAENLRCRVMLTAFPDKPRAKIIVFVGHAEDAAVASECYRLTLKVAQRCFKLYSKSCRDSGCPIDVTVTAVRNAYYIGFAEGLYDAYSQQVAENSELAICLQVPSDVQAFFEAKHLNSIPKRRITVSDEQTRDNGRIDGYSYGTGCTFD